MQTIPFNHKPHQRNIRQVRTEILATLPNKGDQGQITTDDPLEAKNIEGFLRRWASQAFTWKREDTYPHYIFTLTKKYDTEPYTPTGYVEVPPHTT